jgi:tRNA 2-thiouridine synthesizing protein A
MLNINYAMCQENYLLYLRRKNMVEANQTLDCKGLSCPMPIMKLAKTMKQMEKGSILELLATDPGSKPDVPAWCKKTGNELLETAEEDGVYKYYIKCK